MSPETLNLAHFGAGTAALTLYWATFAQTKGSPGHKRLGRWFALSWVPVLVSIGGILLLAPDRFDPADAVQFFYLSICVVVVIATGILSLRWKRDLARFRGHWFKAGGVTIFALGAAVLAAGLVSNQPVPVALSSVGLIYGGAMIRFAWMRAAAHPNWPMIWHLNAMIFLFNAIHGTLAAAAWRSLIDPSAGDMLNVGTHVATLAICLVLRRYWGARRNAPMRLTATPSIATA